MTRDTQRSFCGCKKYHGQEQLTGGTDSFGFYFQVTAYHWGKSGRNPSKNLTQGPEKECSLLGLLRLCTAKLLIQPRPTCPELCATHSGWGLPHQPLTKTIPHRLAHRPIGARQPLNWDKLTVNRWPGYVGAYDLEHSLGGRVLACRARYTGSDPQYHINRHGCTGLYHQPLGCRGKRTKKVWGCPGLHNKFKADRETSDLRNK